jgi:hypothetical protein
MPDLQSVSDSNIFIDADSMPGLEPVSVSGSSDSICADELEGECEGEDWFFEIDKDLDSPWAKDRTLRSYLGLKVKIICLLALIWS